jgi:glyoxalase superfamily protein
MARIFNLTFGARDPVRLGAFWSQAVGYHVSQAGPQLVRLRGEAGAPDMLFLQVRSVFRPSNLHLDLAADDPVAEVGRLLSLGASAVDTAEDGSPRPRQANGIEWFVLTDPEGNEFCVGGEP